MFCYLPSVTLEITQSFLEQIALSDLDAEHVVIWDGAGFHHRADDPRVPSNIHLVSLPAYSPELNHIERVWKLTRRLCTHNQYFDVLEKLVSMVEGQFEKWFKPNETLHRLCAIN